VHFLRLLEYVLVRLLLAVLQGMPYEAALKFGSLLGKVASVLARPMKAQARRNLDQSYTAPEKSRTDRILRGVFDTLGRHAAEFAHLARRRGRGFTLVNPEILTEAHRQARGIILVSAHLGCFARLVVVPSLLGIPASAIMKKQRNVRLHRWVIGLMKRHFKVDVLLKTNAVDHIAVELQRGRMVGFFADQHPRHGGVEGVFFGRPVRIPPGPAVYARRCGAPIVILTLHSRADGTHVARFEGPIRADGTLEDISRRWLSVLEDRIREHPEEWMWMHRRWRAEAGGDPVPDPVRRPG